MCITNPLCHDMEKLIFCILLVNRRGSTIIEFATNFNKDVQPQDTMKVAEHLTTALNNAENKIKVGDEEIGVIGKPNLLVGDNKKGT